MQALVAIKASLAVRPPSYFLAGDPAYYSPDWRPAFLKEDLPAAKTRWLPLGVFAGGAALWGLLSALRLYPESAFPPPAAVLAGFGEEIGSGRLFEDLVVSLFRVTAGFLLAVLLSVPFGLWLGHHPQARTAFLPAVNFFRNLSPLAWIPFAVLWFGIGDAPAIFLIFLSTFFPMALAVTAAVASIPAVYFQVGREYGLRGVRLLTGVTLPAIMPQFITALRVTAGVAWLVVVAAEMISGRDGLGFAIWDSRNGLRTDLTVVGMIVIGLIGVAIDRLLVQLTRMPGVRWGYER
jgi:NitT/TauT family transport system permease protein